MSERVDLAVVVARDSAMALIEAHAAVLRCRVGVYGADGAPLRAAGELATARPSGVNGHARVDGAPQPCAVAPVVAFDALVGYVVVGGDAGDRRADVTLRVAEHGAAVLAELCEREYELNDLSREILGSYEELNLFYDLARELAEARDPEGVCRAVLARATRVIAAADAWVLLAEGPRGGLRVAAARDPSVVGALQPLAAGRAGAAFATGHAEAVDDVAQIAPDARTDLERRAARSLVSVPLSVPGDDDRPSLGVLQLADRVGGGAFTSGDVKLAQAIASHAAVLIQNSRLIGYERELKIARTIQQSLLPGRPPVTPGFDVAGACLPASNVGGDYFDHLVTAAGTLVFLVADVSGHDLASALLQTTARAALRAAAVEGGSPGTLLSRTSRAIHDDLSRAELFITTWLGSLDLPTGRLTYSDAGHNAALLRRAATGETLTLSTGGIPIGVMQGAKFDESSLVLEPGDVLVAYTDGLTEAAPGDDAALQFGEARLAEALGRFAHLPASEIVKALADEVTRFTGGRPPSDDRSLVVLRRLPSA